ncbi:hypothetical protein JXR01_03205 [Candidatus Kaiserbacteria bacterium]|nr:MAG: hypothetical protein JXR01_03205 [Candidatus Kaiserbacteria bacterium]
MHRLKENIINFDWSLKSIVKAVLAIVVIVVALSIALGVLNTVAKGVFGYSNNYGHSSTSIGIVEDFVGGFDGVLNMGDSTLSFKSSAPQAMGMGGGSDMMFAESSRATSIALFDEGGADAEEYERRDYNAHYETRKFEETCTAVSDLKPLEYVVFDRSNKSEDWCNYTFRVDIEHEEEIIDTLKALDPRDFNINTSTLERSVEYSESELAMQKRRLESTTQTLNQAESAFNNLIAQATREGDTATLSEVINNKISTIDRLTQQLLNTQERIDRLSKGLGETEEQIEYAHFNVSVSKVVFVDGERIADEWKQRVQEMFVKINETALALTIGLIAFALAAVKLIIFGALLVLLATAFAKVAWVVVKRIWKWEPRRKSEDTFSDSSPM